MSDHKIDFGNSTVFMSYDVLSHNFNCDNRQSHKHTQVLTLTVHPLLSRNLTRQCVAVAASKSNTTDQNTQKRVANKGKPHTTMETFFEPMLKYVGGLWSSMLAHRFRTWFLLLHEQRAGSCAGNASVRSNSGTRRRKGTWHVLIYFTWISRRLIQMWKETMRSRGTS